MKSENLLLGIAVIAVIVSVVGMSITFNSVTTFRDMMTGFASTTGEINLTVEESMAINFTTDSINWGSGQVSAGQAFAILDTSVDGAGNVTDGNWTSNTAGLVIENIGNIHINLSLNFTKNADTLLGGSSPSYQINVTDSEPASCTGGVVSAGTYVDATTTQRVVCANLTYYDSGTANDTLRIDVKLVVPSDSLKGAIGDVISTYIVAA